MTMIDEAERAKLATACTLDDYQRIAMKTWVRPGNDLPYTKEGKYYLTLKLNGEAGEVAEKMGKLIRDKGGWDNISTEDRHALTLELGDVLWYLAVLAEELGITLSWVAASNLLKLRDRKARDVLKGSGDNR